MRRRAIPLVAVLMLLVAACGDESTPAATSTPTPIKTVTPTATATSAPTGGIRGVDFTDRAVVARVLTDIGGGEVNAERTTYADFTGDGIEDAVIVIESGGTLGDLGAALFTLDQGVPKLLGVIDYGGRIEVRAVETGHGFIASLTGVYAAGDAQCCPSRLRERVYQWTGDSLELVTDQEIANPSR